MAWRRFSAAQRKTQWPADRSAAQRRFCEKLKKTSARKRYGISAAARRINVGGG